MRQKLLRLWIFLTRSVEDDILMFSFFKNTVLKKIYLEGCLRQ